MAQVKIETFNPLKRYKDDYQAAKSIKEIKVEKGTYLAVDGKGDPRRSRPENLKTIVRLPVK